MMTRLLVLLKRDATMSEAAARRFSLCRARQPSRHFRCAILVSPALRLPSAFADAAGERAAFFRRRPLLPPPLP